MPDSLRRAVIVEPIDGQRPNKEINLSGLLLLRPEGFLVSCSCSWRVDKQTMLATMPEARYLKCFLLQAF